MKRLLCFLCTLLLFFSLAGHAGASLYYYEDVIDTWAGYGDAAPIVEYFPLKYTHDINDSVNFGAGDTVVEATLELDFTNDLLDAKCFLPSIFEEHIYYAFDGSEWKYLDEVDNGQYDIGIDIALLNVDGLLNVALAVTNYSCGWLSDAWLDHSKLYGMAEAAAVPESSPMLLLGLAFIGLSSFRRKLLKY